MDGKKDDKNSVDELIKIIMRYSERALYSRQGKHVPVSGLFETHLTVSNLQRSIAFYRDIMGLQLAFEVLIHG